MNASVLLSGWLLLSAGLLAGCTGGTVDPSVGLADDVDARNASGASIQGLVVDDEQNPVAGATVALLEDEAASTQTDEAGVYAITGLEPGSYSLFVEKLGYESFAQKVTVGQDETVKALVALVPIVVAEPWEESIPFTGRFECSWAFFADTPVGTVGQWRGCGLDAHSTIFPEDKLSSDFEKQTGATQIIAELYWQEGSAATGNELDFSIVNQERDGCQWYANDFGVSPIRLAITMGEEYENDHSLTPTGCDDTVIDDVDTHLATLVYASPTHVAGTPVFGLSLQQPFDGFVSIFYHQPAPEAFSAIPDA